MKRRPLIMSLGTLGMLGFAVTVLSQTDFAAEMNRIYNLNSGEHFYTNSEAEKQNLLRQGWYFEGIGWNAPASGAAVYRVYNPNNGDHHYTTSVSERDHLVQAGWRDEKIGWYSDVNKGMPIYRVYNPNATGAGSHHYTRDQQEAKGLVQAGWKDEGVGWYGEAGAVSNIKTPKELVGTWRNRAGNEIRVTSTHISYSPNYRELKIDQYNMTRYGAPVTSGYYYFIVWDIADYVSKYGPVMGPQALMWEYSPNVDAIRTTSSSPWYYRVK